MSGARRKVLVVGVYFADRENRVRHLAAELARSRDWQVEQRWVALGDAPADLAHLTVASGRVEPKFTLVNRQLRAVALPDYAHVIVCDDDILLPQGFLDQYLATVESLGFALAQPARTHGSWTDHHFVDQLEGIRGRQTRFVEIGPLFSMSSAAARILTPFDERSPMGWGYDFVWPVAIEGAGLAMGIVDQCAVAHDLRKPVSSYSRAEVNAQMAALLQATPHLDPPDAFQIVRSFV